MDLLASLTSILLHSYAKNLYEYIKKEIRSITILTVCLVKVTMKFLLSYKRLSYIFWKRQS
uniref:Uncharacterized protein n=1 Tax=Canis lupus dingo TaxID=286419 RepID=A0A8C0KAY6_CANLU